MPEKKEKPNKTVTEIPNATVKIEVEEDKDETITTTEIIAPKEEEITPEVIEENEESGGMSWKKMILYLLIIVPIGILMFGGILYFAKNMDLGFLNKTPERSKTLTLPEVSSTPTPVAIDKKSFTITIQNGSGITGEGAKVKITLDAAGYKTGDVENADNSDYTNTIIKASDKVSSAFLDELTKTLEERGPVGKVEKFATGEDGEVTVIIGATTKDTSETPTPTP